MTRDKLPRRGFLVWLAGPSRKYIARAPSTIDFYRKVGAALLIPFTLGTLGVSILLHTALEAEGIDPKLVAVGVAVGVLIVVADRMLIAARARTARGRFLLNLLRVLLSVALAAVVSEPLIASFFADEAIKADRQAFRQEMESRRDDAAVEFDDSIGDAQAVADDEIESLDKAIARQDRRVAAAEDLAEESNEFCLHEVASDDGRGGEPGYGPQAEFLCSEADAALREANAEKNKAERKIAAFQKDKKAALEPVKELQDQRGQKLAQIASRRYEQDLGAWERMELARAHVGWWYWLAILAGLLVLDTLAVMSKMLKGKTAYDEQIDCDDEVSAAEARERVDNVEDERRHRRNLAAIAREGDVADQEEMLAIRAEVRARLHDRRVERELARALEEDGKRYVGGANAGVSRPSQSVDHRSNSISSTSGTRIVAIRQRKLIVERKPFASGGFSSLHFAQWERALQPDRPFERGVMALKLPWGDPFGDGLTLDPAGAKRFKGGQIALLAEAEFYAMNPTLKYAPRLVTDGGDKPLLLLEYLERGNLKTWLFPKSTVAFTVRSDEILSWMVNVIAILDEFWKLSRVLVDGKMENLLVRGRLNEPPFARGFRGPTFMPDAAGALIACDFGSVVPKGAEMHSDTRRYAPPEYRVPPVPRAHFTGDVFTSLGITCFRICTGGGMPEQNKYGEVTRPDPRRYNPQVPAPLAELVMRWLSTDPGARISVDRSEPPERIVEGLKESVRNAYRECERTDQTGAIVLAMGDRGVTV